MINVSQHSHGRTVAVWLMCSCPHMFVEEPFLYQEKFSCAWALVSCILFCNLSNKFLCFCVCTKTWKMTIADAKEQQQLAPNPKVLEKPFHFSCAFTRKFSDTFIPFNLDVGKWNFTWQMSPYLIFKRPFSFFRDWRMLQEKPITLYWKTSKQSSSWICLFHPLLPCHYFSHHPFIYFGLGNVIFLLPLSPSDSQVCPSPTAAMSCRPPSRCRSSSARETPSTNSSASSLTVLMSVRLWPGHMGLPLTFKIKAQNSFKIEVLIFWK